MLASVFKGTCVLYDIRTYELSRKFSPILLSQDHKPTREDEIDYWLSDHRFKGRMAILDDEILEGDLRPWQVLTFQETGLTSQSAMKVIGVLKSGPAFGL